MGGEKILVGLRGAKNYSVAFRIVFRVLFRVFQTVFRVKLKFFSVATSFCRRAALKHPSETIARHGVWERWHRNIAQYGATKGPGGGGKFCCDEIGPGRHFIATCMEYF